MAAFRDIARLSPLPIVDLHNINEPLDGLLLSAPEACARNFSKGDVCRRHYEQLAKGASPEGQPIQCPYGFASYPITTKRLHIALTGVIPFPRLGGAKERQLAKKNGRAKIPIASFGKAEGAIREVEERMEALENKSIEGQSVALHEIRKLNRTVKQTAERICLQAAPNDPDQADPQLVRIWKTAELMSLQFDVIELLANESLVELPLNFITEVYRIFDKCVRIYQPAGMPDRITLRGPYDYRSRVVACDKTFNMIPTVLIENALKHSVPNSPISIDIRSENSLCVVRVRNTSILSRPLTDSVFEKGVRMSSNIEGSGNGLHLAKLVARQHSAELSVSTRTLSRGIMECTFTLRIPEVPDLPAPR